MNKSFLFKILGIFSLILVMTIALNYINSIILERQHYNDQTKFEIAKSSAGQQTLVGPILVVPYIEEYTTTTTENNIKKTETKRDNHLAYYMPKDLKISGGFSNEFKKLDIYKAMMYVLGGQINGSFEIPEDLGVKPSHPNGVLSFQNAYISVGISDPRGITETPSLMWNNQKLSFEQGSEIKALGNGIHASVGNIEGNAGHSIPFELTLNLRGMETFNFTPMAENNVITLQSSWQHPHFNGSFLPEPNSQVVNAQGFKAKWSISSLANNNQATFFNQLENNNQTQNLESLSIGFVEPINVYSQADRATKYGLLFIGLTFIGFYLFEILKQLRIHPAQYTLVGLAMAMFYLLLISFAEIIGFSYAYLIASAACISLLAYYLSFVLKSKTNGVIFASLLTTLYGALYGILASEDNAMLMGSLLVFGLLAITMVITRKIDWYALSTQK
ncbi:MAG: cell envelope integrity protein CreD [Methylophilus sp.]